MNIEELRILITIIWLICGSIGYFYFGHKTKWKEYKHSDVTLFDYLIRYIISTICGTYTLICVVKALNQNKEDE